MILKHLEVTNIACFDKARWDFREGYHRLALGSQGGATALRSTMMDMLLPKPDQVFRYTRLGSNQSKAKLSMKCGNVSVIIEKQWRHGSISSWSAKYGDKTAVLMEPNQSRQWQAWFLRQAFIRSLQPTNDPELEEWYSACVHLILDTGYALLHRCEDRDFVLACSGFEAEVTVGRALQRLYMTSAERSDQLKSEQRREEDEKAVMATDAADLKAVETDMAEVQSLIVRIEERAQKVKQERSQWLRVQKYLDSKRDELRALNTEIEVYSSALQDDGVVDVSGEEFRDLERKSRQYEQITKNMTALQERLIEQRHLQKNIEGLQKEMDELQSQTMDARTQKQIRIYEGEIKRMSKIIANIHNLNDELAAKEEERSPLLASYRKFTVLSKSHKLLSQNDAKKLRTTLKKAMRQRDVLLQEIGGLEADAAGHGLANAISQEDSLKQQLRELQKRSDELNRILASKAQNKLSGPSEEREPLGTRLQGELSVKAYLNVACDLWHEALWQRWKDFLYGKIKSLEDWPKVAASLFKSWQNNIDSVRPPEKQPAWSDTESSLLALVLRVLWLSRPGCVVFLDDEWEWRFDSETRSVLQKMIEHQGVRQIIQFAKT